MCVERRNLMKTALASAAVAVSAIPPGCMMSPAAASIRKAAPYIPRPTDDAELIEIGREIDAGLGEWLPVWEESNRLFADWLIDSAKRGLRFDHMAPDELVASQASVGYDAAEAKCEGLAERLDALVRRAWAITPSTPAGLAALAKAARWECMAPGDLLANAQPDYGPKRLLMLLASIEAFAHSVALS